VSYQYEASAVLAHLSDPAIRHALVSLRALHDGLVDRKHAAITDGRSTSVNDARSLDAYNAAVSSLALRLKEQPGRESAQAALVCCQMFISIEVLLGDYATAFQHLQRGLRIMYQYQSRPGVGEDGRVVPCGNPGFPHLDSFAIKLFASGCPGPKHMSSGARDQNGSTTTLANIVTCDQARSDLSALSSQVLEFLGRVTDLRSSDHVAELRARKTQILSHLQFWEQLYSSIIQTMMEGIPVSRVRFGTAFSLLLHRVLRIVVGQALSTSPIDVEEMDREFYTLDKIASFVTETRRAEIGEAQRKQLAVVMA
jgi:hypothetical protein